ncbi:MAG TPA: amino acid adenylation domain-containing protein [Terracidiphilus sp.]
MREKTTIEFLSFLRSLGVRLTVKDDKLSCTAPKGVLTPPLATELKERKTEIMALLSQNSGQQISPITRLDQGEYEPSAGQRQLWFLDRLDPNSSAYNISFALRLTGTMNRTALEMAIREIIRRHEVLRTAIVEREGAPVAILRDASCALEYDSLKHLPDENRESALHKMLKDEGRRRFDLATPPLLRVRLIELQDDIHALVVTIHHIAADGYSVKVFFEELIALYQAFTNGAPSPLSELPVQYSDYAVWHAENFERNALESELRYWKEKLREPLAVTEVPCDRSRPANPSPHGARLIQLLPTHIWEKVRAFSQSANTTPFGTLLAAYYLLLFRYTRQNDLVVGSASLGRGRSEIDGLIGLFINNLVLRTNLEGDPTITELVERVRETVLGAFAHENVPLERLVEAVQPHRDAGRAPLFQTMFVYQNRIDVLPDLQSLKTEAIFSDTGNARYDLTIEAAESDNKMLLTWEYSTELFDRSTIERLRQHYQNLLEGMIDDPLQAISTVPILSSEERSQIVLSAVAEADYPKDLCVHQWIERQCALTPDAIAVRFQDQALTYRQLDQRSQHLARHLESLGVGTEALVGVLLERSIELVVAMLAVLKTGGAYIPLDPSFPKDRLSFMLEDSRAAVLITQESLLATAPASNAVTVCLDRLPHLDDHDAEIPGPPRNAVHSQNRAYVIYTSGSTGTPKGVEVLHRSLTNFLASMQREPGIHASDRLLAVTTPSFDIAGLELYLPLISGARLVIAPKFAVTDGAILARMLEDERITMMQATPMTWRLLLESGWEGSPGLKILCGGEALGRELANRLIETGAAVWNLYGPTETTIWSTLHRLERGEGPVPIGRPIANTQIYVLDNHFEPVPLGAIGELFIGGDGVARGYLDRPDLTASRFLADRFRTGGRMYRTGDLARMLPGGVIEYMGRADAQVKLRGFRIELGEIETVLERQPGVRQAVVIVREDSPGDQRLIAYIVALERDSVTSDMLREALGTKLPDYMVPAAYVFLETFPLTPNRKVDRKALPAPTASATTRSANYVSPRTNSERQVAAIWELLLNNQNVGATENFFDLGGHSLLVIRLQARLRQQFGWEPSLIELFQYPTVASIAKLMDSRTVDLQMATGVTGD